MKALNLYFIAMLTMLSVHSRLAHGDIILSGAIVFSTSNTGTFDGTDWWHTLGTPTNQSFNLYVTQANTGIGGAFANSGDGGSASISLPLSLGDNTFHVFGEPGNARSHYAANFFLNGETAPSISVFGARDELPSPPFPAFQANASNSTLSLAVTSVPGSGVLSRQIGNEIVSLTSFRFSLPSVEALDRVSGFDNTPSGVDDYVGSFTLSVTAVPEPSSVVLCGFAGSIAIFLRRRRPVE